MFVHTGLSVQKLFTSGWVVGRITFLLRKLGNIADEEWLGNERRKYNVSKVFTSNSAKSWKLLLPLIVINWPHLQKMQRLTIFIRREKEEVVGVCSGRAGVWKGSQNITKYIIIYFVIFVSKAEDTSKKSTRTQTCCHTSPILRTQSEKLVEKQPKVGKMHFIELVSTRSLTAGPKYTLP